MARVLLDFDGTLAHSPGRWRQCVVDVLDDLVPGHGVSIDEVRPHLRGGFPWHRPDEPHLHLDTPDAWWEALGPLLTRTFEGCGVDPQRVPDSVAAMRVSYCDPARFHLYPDTIESLELLRSAGHVPVILSNHVPELPAIVDGLGVAALVDDLFTSASIGYEKPHPEAFRTALAGADPAESWMIGDNPDADVAGAERSGLRAILVRHPDGERELIGAVDRIVRSGSGHASGRGTAAHVPGSDERG
jgi:putative hydrolase of the HAD superfamily